jgi:hypothetical protein
MGDGRPVKVVVLQRRCMGIFRRQKVVAIPHIDVATAIDKFRAYRSIEVLLPAIWKCSGSGQEGFGVTQKEAWDDWARRQFS